MEITEISTNLLIKKIQRNSRLDSLNTRYFKSLTSKRQHGIATQIPDDSKILVGVANNQFRTDSVRIHIELNLKGVGRRLRPGFQVSCELVLKIF